MRITTLKNVHCFCFVSIFLHYMTIFLSYSQQKYFPGRKIKRFSTICISKPPENYVFGIIFCLWVHCIITAVLQVASKRQPERKYSSKADPILVQLQKYSEISLLTLFMGYIWSAHWRWLALYSLPFRLCHTITALTVPISVFTMGIFWKKADSPVWKHLLSPHIIFLLPHLSNELFKEFPGEWEQVGNSK